MNLREFVNRGNAAQRAVDEILKPYTNGNTPGTKHKIMDEKNPQIFTPLEPLTTADQQLIILALGVFMGMSGLDDDRNFAPAGKAALEVARKFGVSY